MRKPLTTLLVVVMVAMLSGCAALFKPSKEELAKADYGVYPIEYQEIVKQHCQTLLKDPGSAQYNFVGPPKRGHFKWFGPAEFGFYGVVWVNAKNSFGGYAGAEKYNYLIRHGRVIKFVPAMD